MSHKNLCVKLGLMQCTHCAISRTVSSECWVPFYERIIKDRVSGYMSHLDVRDAIQYQLAMDNDFLARNEPYLSWFRAAIARSYPEHTKTVDTILLLR